MENIFDQLCYESFSGKIAFIHLNSRNSVPILSGPPFGLMCLMGGGRDLSIPYGFIEADAYNMSDSEVVAAINQGKYNYVGISLPSLRALKIFPLLEKIKRETSTQIIVGGPLPTVDTQWLMETCRVIDYAVLGEGESILPQLLLAIEKKKPLDSIPGLAYREGDTLIVTYREKSPLPCNILPMPDFEAPNYRYYQGNFSIKTWPSANIYVSRGCPFRCTFCSNPIWSHKPDNLPVSIVMQWLELLARKNIQAICFSDDTLNLDCYWFEELCLNIIRSRLNRKMAFYGCFRADLTQRAQLELARRANFWKIFYGAESGDQHVLDYYKKGERIEDIANAIEMTRAAGLKSLASFIVGAPIDTATTLLETANFIRQIDPTYAAFQLLIPFMGTEISKEVVKEGILTAQEIREYDHTNPTIRTLTLSTQDLLEFVDFMREDFLEFKQSALRRLKRKQELQSHNIKERQIIAQLEHESKEAQSLIKEIGQPENQFFDKNTIDMTWFSDEIQLFTEDLRLRGNGWHISERTHRWSSPVFELPFFLKKEKNYIEIHWASMRPKAKIKISFSTSHGDFTLSLIITNPDWHKKMVELPRVINGPVWIKFQIHDPFFAPNDSRELGMAFKTIRFLDVRQNAE